VGRLTPLDRVLALVGIVLGAPLLAARQPFFGDWAAMLGALAVALFGWMVLLASFGIASEPERRSRVYRAAATAGFLPGDPAGRRIAGGVLVLVANAIPVAVLLSLSLGLIAPALGFFAAEACLVTVLVIDAAH
jgi:hypothetical protein